MKRAMLLAIMDTLFPGDEGDPPLPSASRAALDLQSLERLAEPVVAALGDADGFLTASAAEREARLRTVEQDAPEPFKLLLAGALADYYEAAPVLAVFGWRIAPPQPHGHTVAPADESTLRNLEKVRRRGQLWRD